MLTRVAGTLTGGRSLISKAETKVETPKSWAVCLITTSQSLKMRRVKLNTHVVASVNLCAWNRIRDTSRNGRHEISGASACRCRSCRPRPMHGTLIRFLRLGNFMSVLHIVEARWWSEWKGKISWLHKWYLYYESDFEWLLLSFRASSGEYMDISIKTLGFSSLRNDIEYFTRWTNLFTLTFIPWQASECKLFSRGLSLLVLCASLQNGA